MRRKSSKSLRILKIAALLLALLFTASASGCSGKSAFAKIYDYDSETKMRTKLRKSYTEDKQDFIIELINNKTPIGDATGEEKPNFEIVYFEGSENEYSYFLIVDLNNEKVVYITDDQGGTAVPKVYDSGTGTLEFYDEIMQ